MSDTREQIMVRLLQIAEALAAEQTDATDLPLIRTAFRNKIDISEADKPAISIMDGDEEPTFAPDAPGKPRLADHFQTLRPEIVLITQAPVETAGTRLNAMRAALLRATLGDAMLVELVGPNGFVRYEGCRPRFVISAQTDARMLVMVAIGYILKPSAL